MGKHVGHNDSEHTEDHETIVNKEFFGSKMEYTRYILDI
jgi:hypothetical protein